MKLQLTKNDVVIFKREVNDPKGWTFNDEHFPHEDSLKLQQIMSAIGFLMFDIAEFMTGSDFK